MISINFIIIVLGFIFALIILLLILRLIFLYHKLENSFSKLGYIIREDSKKFFLNSEEKNQNMQEANFSDNKNIVKQAVEEILDEQKKQVTITYIETQKQAEKILTEARGKADQIISQAKKDSQDIFERVMGENPGNEEPGGEDNMTDIEADADTLKSAGMGTDEDYGYFGNNEQ